MKNFTITACFCMAMAFGALAQDRSKTAISLQPLWGPTGYNVAAYYYLPDIEAYYDIPEKKFIFNENGEWINSSNLPEKYKSYDLYKGYKVVLNRPHPYFNYNAHKERYGRFKGQFGRQLSIKDSTNPKYFVVEGHPRSASQQAAERKDNKNSQDATGN